MTTHKPFTGAPPIGFLANFYPLNREKTHTNIAQLVFVISEEESDQGF
jgi:hypothetical protein